MDLYVLRHGRAGDPLPGRADRLRPLTAEGRERTTITGRAMRRLGVAPALVLSSPLVRARETAALAAAELETRPEVVIVDFLAPGAGPRVVREAILREYGDVDPLMIVGHEPDLSALVAASIARDGSARVQVKKGALVHLAGFERELAELRALFPPKALLALGER